METGYIEVGDDKWGIVIVYNFDTENEYKPLSAIMRSFGLRERNINRSLRILSTFNSGMTISVPELRMSVIFIGDATSESQWWSTITHELLHAQQAILDYYGVGWEGESSAYTIGYLTQRAMEEIGKPCY